MISPCKTCNNIDRDKNNCVNTCSKIIEFKNYMISNLIGLESNYVSEYSLSPSINRTIVSTRGI